MLATIAEGTACFVLDDGGVLFSAERQEMHVLNGPAMFVWCCLESALDLPSAVAAYARTFSLTPSEAERVMADVLCRWQGLGLVADVRLRAASPVDLTTALGRLLTTPQLRRSFAQAPLELARSMPLRESDIPALLALDPRALEAQAALLQERMRQMRHAPAQGSVSPPRHPAPPAGGFAACHRYRLLGTTIEIRYASARAAAIVHPVLAHLAVLEEFGPHAVLEVLDARPGWVIVEDGLPRVECRQLPYLAPLVKSAVRRIALERHRCFAHIHAAVVSDGARCLALPAAAGSGKTTLTAALVHAGLRYFSDEYAPLEAPGMQVRPVPLALSVKPGAADALLPRFPHLAQLPVHRREDDQAVRYLPPPGPTLPDDAPLPISWLVFPRYTPAQRTILRPLARPQALRMLLKECLVLPRALDRESVEQLVRWFRAVECFELSTGNLDEAVRLVLALCQQPEGSRTTLRTASPERP